MDKMIKNRRVAIITLAYSPFIGGAELAVKEITDRLSDFEFDIYTARFQKSLPKEEKIGNANVFRIGIGHKVIDKFLFAFLVALAIRKKHNQSPYSKVHAIMANYAGLAGLIIKKTIKDLPYILTLQSGDSDFFIWKRTWFWYPIYKQIYVKADKITAISNWLKNRALNYGYKSEVKIIPNGVDVKNFTCKMRADERDFVRNSWGFSSKDFLVVTASRLVKKNGVDILISSLEHLPLNIKIVVVGAGKEEEILKLQSKNFEGRVIFLGEISHEHLPRVLKACDVFARPSRSEGFGNAFLEAMSVGLPVIGTSVGGIVDFLQDKETGILALPEDAKSVAKAIDFLIKNPVLSKDIAKKGQVLSRENYSWELISKKYREVYESFDS